MLVLEDIEVFACTDVGRKRKHNEDNYLVDNELRLFIVADGMGGHAAGEVASAMAVRGIRDAVAANRGMLQARASEGAESGVSVKHILSLLEAAVQRASARIHNEARNDRKKRGMGTTVSLILFIGSHGYVAHVGDSRIYLIRNETAYQVTEDHTIANELLKLGMVKPEQLAQVPRKNAITRAVGVYEHVEVDTLTLEVLPNDRFVLASDGLCGYLDDDGQQLSKLLEVQDGQACVQGMIDYANGRGGKDNVTAVLVQLGGDAVAAGDMAERMRMKRQVLATMPLFSKLSDKELLRILHVALLLHVDEGDDAVREGDAGDCMYVVLSGKFEVLKGPAVLRSLGSGEHFGEMALLRNTTRSATVRAAESGELVVIRRSDFFEIIRTEPHVAVKLLWQFLGVLSERLDQTSTELSHAREELEGEYMEAIPILLENEVEVDPFTVQPNNMLTTMPLNLEGDSPAPPPIDEPHTFPGFDEAPEMAARRDGDPDNRIDDSPSFDDAPEMAARLDVDPDNRIDDSPSFDDAPEMAARLNIDPDNRIDDSPSFDDAPEMATRLPQEHAEVPTHMQARKEPRQRVETDSSSAPTRRNLKAASLAAAQLGAQMAARKAAAAAAGDGEQPRVHTLASAGAPPDVDDLAKTRVRPSAKLADTKPSTPSSTKPPSTQPSADNATTRPSTDLDPEDTRKTIPLTRKPKLDKELQALREQFKQRLKTSREQRKSEDSD